MSATIIEQLEELSPNELRDLSQKVERKLTSQPIPVVYFCWAKYAILSQSENTEETKP